jgi:syntaxin-binding protein 5
MEKGGKSPCITVLQGGKATTVLHMEHPVVDFVTMCESPWQSDMQEPYAIAVLLLNDLVIIDLTSNGFPCFDSPYSMDLHDSPVTCCTYLADCPSDLVPAFYSVGRQAQNRKPGTSEKQWPVNGGSWAPASRSYSEIIITGHQDGSVKFWDAGSGSLLVLYKLKTAKIFEKPKTRSLDGTSDDPLAIQAISLCPESRYVIDDIFFFIALASLFDLLCDGEKNLSNHISLKKILFLSSYFLCQKIFSSHQTVFDMVFMRNFFFKVHLE